MQKSIMNKQFLKDSLGWGFILWLIGYILGFILFFVVPPAILGWVIMPIGIVITYWVIQKKIHKYSLKNYILLGLIWATIALIFDYIFIVKMLNPADGYYKLDVYLYYAITFLMPAGFGWWKNRI